MKFLYLLLLPVCAFASKWDVEYWQAFNWDAWERGRWRFYATQEFRFNDNVSHFANERTSVNLFYLVRAFLGAEIHYSYIYFTPSDSSHFIHAQRVELELNPFYYTDNGTAFKWRNRIEFVKTQGVAKIQTIFRHRIKASFPTENKGFFTHINCWEEIFYNITLNKFTQNRFAPFSMTFAFTAHTYLDPYIMIRSVLNTTTNQWSNALVFGTDLRF